MTIEAENQKWGVQLITISSNFLPPQTSKIYPVLLSVFQASYKKEVTGVGGWESGIVTICCRQTRVEINREKCRRVQRDRKVK